MNDIYCAKSPGFHFHEILHVYMYSFLELSTSNKNRQSLNFRVNDILIIVKQDFLRNLGIVFVIYEGRSICNENSPVNPNILYLHTSKLLSLKGLFLG